MRFLDLEHEVGHIERLTERFKDAPPTQRWIEYPDGTQKLVKNPPADSVLSKWLDTITEYHNRLTEWLRLSDRGASTDLLKEHAGGISEARELYQDKGLKGGNSSSRKAWANEHFPDIPELEQKYLAAQGRTME